MIILLPRLFKAISSIFSILILLTKPRLLRTSLRKMEIVLRLALLGFTRGHLMRILYVSISIFHLRVVKRLQVAAGLFSYSYFAGLQAFRIVNKEWEYSHKKGYKCTFERGILHVYFNFKRYRYRR